jgi:hypothetical protein
MQRNDGLLSGRDCCLSSIGQVELREDVGDMRFYIPSLITRVVAI